MIRYYFAAQRRIGGSGGQRSGPAAFPPPCSYGSLAKHFRLVEQPSHLALPELFRNGERFDFVFIDGNHTFDFVLLDFFYADRMLEIGGVIGFDDLWMLAVRQVVAYVMRNRA